MRQKGTERTYEVQLAYEARETLAPGMLARQQVLATLAVAERVEALTYEVHRAVETLETIRIMMPRS